MVGQPTQMIRLLHFSDLHLGVENYGRLDPKTGLSTRVGDFLRSFDAIVEYALEEDIDLVLFCGDAYRTRDPNPTYQREFAERIRCLSRASIPVFLLTGNHDLPLATGKANTMEIFDTLDVPNVVVASTLATQVMETKGGQVQIVALPWPIRSHLVTREEYKNRSLEEINLLLSEATEDLVKEQIENLVPELPAILAAHATVFGATYGSERSVMLGQEVVIPSSVVANPAFDYVALGHIHRHQVLRNADPPVVYAGSIERIDFGEEKEEKGFVVVELNKGNAEFEFVPLQVRAFLTIEVVANPAFDYVALGHIHKHQVLRNADPPVVYAGSIERIDFGEEKEEKGFVVVELNKGNAEFEFIPLQVRAFLTIEVEAKGDDPTAQVWEAIAAHDIGDKVVRLIIHTTADKEPLLKDSEILKALRDAFYVAAVNKDVERSIRLRLGQRNYEEMTPREILERYLQVKQVRSQRAKVLLKYADELLQELE